MTKSVDERLVAAAELFKERNAAYGGNYQKFGPVLAAMFPDGLVLKTEEEFGRFMLFAHLVTKLTRYSQNITRGGHEDSLDDLSVYAMMAAERDAVYKEKVRVVREFRPSPDKVILGGTVRFADSDEWSTRPGP